MTSSSAPWWISTAWISLMLLTFLVIDMRSLGPLSSALLMTTIGIVPPVVLLMLWSDGPPPTVAEVLHTVEAGR